MFSVHYFYRPAGPRVSRGAARGVMFGQAAFDLGGDAGVERPVSALHDIQKIHMVSIPLAVVSTVPLSCGTV